MISIERNIRFYCCGGRVGGGGWPTMLVFAPKVVDSAV